MNLYFTHHPTHIMGMISKKALLEKKFDIEIRGTALKNAYHILIL
ncbi:hypothetical protein ACMAWI_06855 [Helicobacter pylori]